MTQSQVVMFPSKLSFEHRGTVVSLAQLPNGQVHWEFDKVIGTVKLDGIEPDMALARNKAIEMLNNMGRR